jgi:hypothetical protein
MTKTKLLVSAGMSALLLMGASAQAQDMSCDEIEFSTAVTSEYPSIAGACDAVVVKNGKKFARVQVEVQRARGRTLTFKIMNNDGTSGGSYTTTVDSSWRAKIDGRSYRASELYRGQELNVYMPEDRWAVIQEDDDGPDVADATVLAAAPMLPKTAGMLPLFALFGAGFAGIGLVLGAVRRRLTA